MGGGAIDAAEINRARYSDPAVVAYYSGLADLMPAERQVFRRYIPPGLDILDLGIGAGRTTRHLAAQARRYVGVDMSAAMVAACRARFPHLELVHADACDLSFLAAGTFDIILFSFNGIDYIPSDARRRRCFGEIARLLRQDGRAIISSHHARMLGLWPDLAGATAAQAAWRLARAAWLSPSRAMRTLVSRAFWRGHGYVHDPVHGGLWTHVSTPRSIARDAAPAGLTLLETIGAGGGPAWFSPWFTYVLGRAA